MQGQIEISNIDLLCLNDILIRFYLLLLNLYVFDIGILFCNDFLEVMDILKVSVDCFKNICECVNQLWYLVMYFLGVDFN